MLPKAASRTTSATRWPPNGSPAHHDQLGGGSLLGSPERGNPLVWRGGWRRWSWLGVLGAAPAAAAAAVDVDALADRPVVGEDPRLHRQRDQGAAARSRTNGSSGREADQFGTGRDRDVPHPYHGPGLGGSVQVLRDGSQPGIQRQRVLPGASSTSADAEEPRRASMAI